MKTEGNKTIDQWLMSTPHIQFSTILHSSWKRIKTLAYIHDKEKSYKLNHSEGH